MCGQIAYEYHFSKILGVSAETCCSKEFLITRTNYKFIFLPSNGVFVEGGGRKGEDEELAI